MTLKELTTDEWHGLLKDVDLVSFFEYPQWYMVWANYLQATYKTYLIDEHLLLSTIELSGAKGHISFINSSPAGTYSNLRSLKEARSLTRHDIDTLRELSSLNFARLSPFTNVTIDSRDTRFSPEHTQIIRLDNESPIEQAWSRNHIRLLKTARQSSLQITKAQTDDEWSDYYNLYQQFADKKQATMTSLYAKSLFDYIQLLDDQDVTLWLAKRDNQVVAGRLVFYTRDYAVEWHAVSTKEANKLGGNQLLVYAILQDAVARNIRIYDFNPSAGIKGVEQFKQKFGAEKKECPVFKAYDLKQRLYLQYTKLRL